MKTGDIIMIYTDAADCEHEEVRAKLVRLLEICGCFEFWDVEFTDCPDKIFPRLIKKI